jgi:hypothetical protein
LGGKTSCPGTLEPEIDRATTFRGARLDLSDRLAGHDPVGPGTVAFAQVPRALAAVGCNAKPVLEIILRGPDRDIVASAG